MAEKFRLEGSHGGCTEPPCNACDMCEGCRGCCTCPPDPDSRLARGRLHEFYDVFERWQREQDAIERSSEGVRRCLTDLVDALDRQSAIVAADESADAQWLRNALANAKVQLKNPMRSPWR